MKLEKQKHKTKTGAMKHIKLMLLILFIGFFHAINVMATDYSVSLGGDLDKNQLRIDINNRGTYCVYRSNGYSYNKQFFAPESHLFAIKIGNTTFSSGGTKMPSLVQYLDKSTLTGFDKIEDVGKAVTTGVQQEMTKRFTGTYSGKTFSVTLRIMYNASSPDYFVKQATIDLRNIPDGTSVTYAYGWDTYVNGNDFGYAYLVPNLLNLNNNPTETNLHLTTAQVQSLRMVGARNGTGAGSLIGFFPIGRSFDRAYSAALFYDGYCFNIPALTPGNGSPTATANRSQYRMQFGRYSSGSSANSDNSAGVGYDNIPAGEITEIKTGFTFTNSLDGELDYLWNDSKDYKANIGDDVSLKLNYSSYNDATLNNVGFHVNFAGLPIRSACSSTVFTGGTSTGVIGNEFYELRGASIAALGKASVSIPVHITRAGQWTVDGSSITNTTQTLPLGMPAKLTVLTTVSLANAENVNFIQGSSKEITVKFPDGVTADGDVTVKLNYSGATSSFSSLPASVTIPAGQNSAKFTVIASPAGTNQAEVNVTLKGTNQEYVTVASPSKIKLIIWDIDKIGFTINDKNYKEWDGKAFCDATNQLTLTATPASLDGSQIAWEVKIDGVVNNYAGKTATVQPVINPAIITVTMKFAGLPYSATFSIGKTALLWTPENNGNVNNRTTWNDPKNWTPQIVPSTCNTVYIPGESKRYPELTETNRGACDSIFFIQGAELGRPDLLTYNKAFVQYNFGLKQTEQIKDGNQALVLKSSKTDNRMKYSAAVSTPLARERWYMLTSPLRGVVTGDFGFGGFPLTFLRKFGSVGEEYPVGQWSSFYTSMTEPLSATEGFAFYMYGMKNDIWGSMESGSFNDLNNQTYMPCRKDKHYGIKETNGILELPFFADSTNLCSHRTQLYNPSNHQSAFCTVDDGTASGSIFNNLLEIFVTANREPGNGNYRFIAEEPNGSFKLVIDHSGKDIGGDQDFMVGNPYMSSIDMVAFINDNENTIQRQFKIWNGTTFITYKVDGQGVISVDPNSKNETITRYIAPLQSFFLKTRSDYNYNTNKSVAKFNVKNISVTRPAETSSGLRSVEAEENIIRIKAENKTAKSHLLIAYRENASEGFRENEDTKKLFSSINNVPEIYTLADGIPVDINFIGNKGEITIPIGIKTGQTGEITLTFSGMDNYSTASKIELIDAKENRTIDLTGKTDYTYTFNNTEKGIQNGRFSLRINHSITSIPSMDYFDDLTVYGDSQGIYVITPSSNPIQQVIVYNLQGKKLYESASGAGYYPLQGNAGALPVIVKVMTKSQVKTVKINN